MRAIVHLDADAFFAAVEQASDPKLRGKPVAVGGEKRGIIASASYEARKFGIYTPMPTARARKLCPKLIVLPGDFERYEQFSHWMFGYCYDFTPDVEQTSIDEGYFDLSGVRKSPVEIALAIRKAIGQKLKIIVSEGIGTNKLVSADRLQTHQARRLRRSPARPRSRVPASAAQPMAARASGPRPARALERRRAGAKSAISPRRRWKCWNCCWAARRRSSGSLPTALTSAR